MKYAMTLSLLCLCPYGEAFATTAGLTGDPAAIARAHSLLEKVGGRESWAAARTFYVKEHAFLKSGEVGTVEVWRDFGSLTRRLVVHSPSLQHEEVLGESAGWQLRNGALTTFDATRLAEERQGLRQEPYYVYHRLAKGDPRLRLALEGADKLNVFEGDTLLCWFVLDARDNPISWGNRYRDAINQHWYGPLKMFGPVSLPKWGSAADGRWRFEYVDASMQATPLTLPEPPRSTTAD